MEEALRILHALLLLQYCVESLRKLQSFFEKEFDLPEMDSDIIDNDSDNDNDLSDE